MTVSVFSDEYIAIDTIHHCFNCWKPLKISEPQRKSEMVKRDGSESRKNQIYGIWLKPKCLEMGNQQLSSEQEKVQRLSLGRGVRCKRWASDMDRPIDTTNRIRYSLCFGERQRS